MAQTRGSTMIGAWIEFLQLAFALGIGWVASVLVIVFTRSRGRLTGRLPSHPAAHAVEPKARAAKGDAR
ncbi:MAG: hypothetical protein OHK0015_17480 [Chloroflexi bacterium OHK40]